MSQNVHKNWLIVSAIVIAFFAPAFALGSVEATSGLARWGLDVLSWPVDGAQTYSDPTTRFLSALTGGFLLGWGMMIFFLRQWVFDSEPEGVRKALVWGTLCWFVLDSSGSYASGNISNVFFNVLVLLAIVGPMWVPARD